MQNRRRWVFDGLFVGAVTLATSSMAGWMKPDQAGAAIAGGTLGAGIATAYVSRKYLEQERSWLDQKLQAILHQQDSEIEQQLQTLRAEFLQNLTESKRHQQSIQDRDRAKFEKQIQELEKQLNEEKKSVSNRPIVKRNPAPTPLPIPEKTPELDPTLLQQIESPIAWLNAQGITVEPYLSPHPPVIEDAFNKLAVQLGENYLNLAALHGQLKWNSVNGTRFRFYLKNRTQEAIKLNTAFAAKLDEFSFLSRHHYSKEEKLLHIQPHQREDFQRFIQGDWFERLIYYKVSQLLKEKGLQYECLLNPNVVFPNGDRYELDQFYWVEGQPLWIECKSGRIFDNSLKQYSEAREILGVSKSQAFMVVLNLPPHLSEIRTAAWGITVTDQDALLDVLDERFAEMAGKKTTIADDLPQAPTQPEELDPIEAVKLKPFPELRRPMLTALVALFADPDYQPKSINEINPLLKERLNESIRKINPVQLAFIRAGLFYDRSKRPTRSPNQKIARLRYTDIEQLERKFIEQHAKEVLRIDATFFDNPKNVDRYEQAIQGKAPEAETIARLKQTLNQ